MSREIFFVLSEKSGEAEEVEWSKIQTPTEELVVPYDALQSPPEGNFFFLLEYVRFVMREVFLILID